jgi:DNA (cytosine-5)-methyltransferase 1
MNELIIDSFAGGGGASLGIAWATGKSPDIAINHDADAIKMHTANHPDTVHLREDVFKINPRKLTKGRPVCLLWASPDCRDFSRAKGGQPVSRRVRGLAWMVIKWAAEVQPRVIILENVREFEDWGPLVPQWCCRECEWKGTEGQAQLVRTRRRCPRCESRNLVETNDRVRNPAKVGLTFKIWKGKLEAQGYKVEHRTLNAADYGAPTNRKRLFLVARCDGQPIMWPEPTHAAPAKCDQRSLFGPKLKPHRTAAECIDFSQPCLSIFATPAEARDWQKEVNASRAKKDRVGIPGRPLKPKTMRRIALGLMRYVLQNPTPFIVGVGGRAGQSPPTSADSPIGTVTGKNDRAIVDPFLVPVTHVGERRAHPGTEPVPTVTSAKRGEFAVVSPTLVQTGYGERTGQEPRVLDISEPLGTVIAGGQKHALIAAMLSRYNGQKGNESRCHAPAEPIRTVDTQNRFGVVAASLAKFYGGVIGHEIDKPAGTVTQVDHHGLVSASLVKFRGDSNGLPIDEPMPTVTSGAGSSRPAGAPHALGLATAYLARFNHGEKQWNAVEEPLGVVTTQGNKFALVYAFLAKYYGTAIGQDLNEPLGTATAKARFGVVMVEVRPGECEPAVSLEVPGYGRCIVADIGLRMLSPRELARAQGFPDTYLLSGVKSNDVARIGNSVCPPIAKAMVEANYCLQPEVARA